VDRSENAELVYLRDDLELEDVKRRAAELHEALTWPGNPSEPGGLRDLGERLATVSIRENVVLVNLPVAEEYGVVASLEPEAAGNLRGLVGDCRAVMEEWVEQGGDLRARSRVIERVSAR